MNILKQSSTYEGLTIAGAIAAHLYGIDLHTVAEIAGILYSLVKVFIAKN
jgi:stage V sporulation protein SpoVS